MSKNENLTQYHLFVLAFMAICLPGIASPALVNTECEPPCWHNIIPGETEEQELLQILEGISVVNSNSIIIKSRNWNGFSNIAHFELLSKAEAEVYLMENVVVMIGFFGDLDIEFGEAVDSLGEPESMIVFQIGGPAPIFGTPTHMIVYAVTPTEGVSVGLDLISWSGEIKPKMQTSTIYYFDPDMYNTLLEVGMFSRGYLDATGTFDITQPWTGYGTVNILAPRK